MTIRTNTHNRLVKNNVPSSLEKAGYEVEVKEVKDEVEFLRLLLDQLEVTSQDAGLVVETELLDELAHLETIIDDILRLTGYSRKDLKDKQDEQEGEAGTYSRGFYLKTTSKEESSEEES